MSKADKFFARAELHGGNKFRRLTTRYAPEGASQFDQPVFHEFDGSKIYNGLISTLPGLLYPIALVGNQVMPAAHGDLNSTTPLCIDDEDKEERAAGRALPRLGVTEKTCLRKIDRTLRFIYNFTRRIDDPIPAAAPGAVAAVRSNEAVE